MMKLAVILILGCIVGCSSLPSNDHRQKSYAQAPSSNTRLGHELDTRLGSPPSGQSAFSPLVTGQEALLARLVSANLADKTLDIQYYIWNNDLTGLLMLDYVLRAADRGVRVRILLDDLNQGKYERMLTVLDTHPNIEIRLVNPFANRGAQWMDALRFSKVNKRMHNKVFIADNLLGIVGGRNIGNEYFWASQDLNFGDFDLWAAGPVVRDLSKEFDTYWNSEIAYPVASLLSDYRPMPEDLVQLREQIHQAAAEAQKTEYDSTLLETAKNRIFRAESQPIFWSSSEVVFDPPAKFHQSSEEQNSTLRFQLRPYLEKTEKEMILISPYFVPENGMDFFKSLQKRHVRAVVLTNSLASSDVATVFSGYKGYRKELLQAGVELYELKPTASATLTKTKRNIGSSGSSQSGLHGKVFIFDRHEIFVGSMNLDPRSLELNSEMGVVVHSPALAGYVAEGLLKNLPESAYKLSLSDQGDLRWEAQDNGKKFEFTKDPNTTWWKRFKAGVMGIVVPTSQL